MTKQDFYKRYSDMICTPPIDAAFIRGIVRAFNNVDRREHGWSVSSVAAKLSSMEASLLRDAVSRVKPRIDERLTAKGHKWLQSRKVQRELGNRERTIVADLSHFTLCDFVNAHPRDGVYWLPVWCVHAHDGSHFTYYAGPVFLLQW